MTGAGTSVKRCCPADNKRLDYVKLWLLLRVRQRPLEGLVQRSTLGRNITKDHLGCSVTMGREQGDQLQGYRSNSGKRIVAWTRR